MERHILTHKLFSVLLLLLVSHLPSFGGEELAQQIAKVLTYPSERLTIEDRTSEVAEKSKGNYFSVIQLTSKDNSFASMELAISKRGIMLKPEVEAYCEKLVSDGSNVIKKFELAGGGYGYSGLGLGGPGGSEERITATWPERGIDIQIKVRMTREGLISHDETKDYYNLLMQGGEPLNEKLIDAVIELAAYAEKERLYTSSDSRTGDSQVVRKPATSEPMAPPNELPSPIRRPEESPDHTWIWIAGIVLALAAMILLFKRRP